VVNSGTIAGTGTGGVGVLLGMAGASYTETAANYGTITAYTGIIAAGAYDTVTNGGIITGSGGTAVMLAGGSDQLVVDPGATFYGIANGGGGNSVLALAGISADADNVGALYIGTLAGIGSSFVNFGSLMVEAGAAWEASGYASAYPFINDGTVIISNGIVATGDTLVFGTLGENAGYNGVVDLGNYGTAQFTGAVEKGQSLVFTDATGLLQLADPNAFAARISGFQDGDVIELLGVAVDSDRYDKKGKLSLSDDGSKVGVLRFDGRYRKGDFQVSYANGNSYITTTAQPLAASQALAFLRSG
jgi:hypothetical protein